MEIKLDETNNLNKLWEKKAILPLLQKDKRQNYLKRLQEVNITKVTALNTLGKNINDWTSKEQLTLVILPINNTIEQTGTNTKDALRLYGMTVRENYLAIDIITRDQECINKSLCTYYPTKNIIIAKINPFYDETGFERLIQEIVQTQAKFRTQEEIWDERLAKQWKQNYDHRENQLQQQIEDKEYQIETTKQTFTQLLRQLRESKETLKGLKEGKKDIIEHIKEELAKIRQLPFIQNIEVTDHIKIGFGDTYITAKVETGRTEATPTKPAQKVFTKEKIYIGPLTFTIRNGEITIQNPKRVMDYEHPHAVNGKCCFGESDLKVKQYLQNVEIAKLVHHLFAWSRSYCPEGGPFTNMETFYNARKEQEENEQNEN